MLQKINTATGFNDLEEGRVTGGKLALNSVQSRLSIPALGACWNIVIQKLPSTNELADDRVVDALVSGAPGVEFAARWIDSADQLTELESSWSRLAAMAVRRNLFFESNFLIPVFEHLNTQQARVLVVEASQVADPDGPRVLCGLVPLIKRSFYFLPLPCYEIWCDDKFFDGTPLIRKDCAFETLSFIFDFLAQEGTSLFSIDTVAADGKFGELLTEIVEQRGLQSFQRNRFSRAAFQPQETAEKYFASNLSKSLQKNVRRLERRLRDQGNLTVAISDADSDVSRLSQQFLELEASGWKGKEGTALACQPTTAAFFRQMVERSARADRVSFLSLRLNGKPIAMLCDLYAEGTGCAYKTAFDESYSQFSPGLLAEIKNIEFMHESNVTQMDSCTDPENATINRIWRDSLEFQSLVIALQGRLSNLAIRAMPLMQSTAQTVKRLLKK